MKLNQIAIASLVLVAGSAFAETATTANCALPPLATASSLVTAETIAWMDKCKPSMTFVLAGSSALAGSLDPTIKSLFLNDAPITVRDMTGPYGVTATLDKSTVKIYYGIYKKTSKPAVVYYQNQNGSAAGVTALMGKKGNVPEAKMIDLSRGGATRCVVNAIQNSADCSNNTIDHVADLAVSDVAFSELLAFSSTDGKLSKKEKDITGTKLPMLGFGVAVSKELYLALQSSQFGANANCSYGTTAASYTAACQPSLTRLQVATLLSKDGSITNLAELLGITEPTAAAAFNAKPFNIARRDEASGTQATSQMFFNGSGCDKKVYTAETSNARKGPPGTTSPIVTEHATSSGVTTALNHASNLVIGVIPLSSGAPSNMYSTDGSIKSTYLWRFIKLDNVSPDLSGASFNEDGSRKLDDKVRAQMVSGAWPLQVQPYSYYLTKAKPEKIEIAKAFNVAMNDSTANNPGLSYHTAPSENLDRKTTVNKVGGNCSPLIKIN